MTEGARRIRRKVVARRPRRVVGRRGVARPTCLTVFHVEKDWRSRMARMIRRDKASEHISDEEFARRRGEKGLGPFVHRARPPLRIWGAS